jgi:nucleoside-diphosphate-sugar epimerase
VTEDNIVRVVVVGGTGIMSVGIVKALLQAGHEVTVFNRGQRVPPDQLPRGVRFIRGDRKARVEFEATMQRARFDAALDMICYTAEDAESDVRAFRGVQHFIQTSTCATFGGPRELPTDENSPLLPISDYGRNKVDADKVFMQAHARGDLPVTIFKPHYIWGPGMSICRQISHEPYWIDRMRRGRPLLVTAEGELFMCHCHSDDAGVAYAAALGRTACQGQTYILTSPRPQTWRRYHEQVAAGLGLKITLVDAPADFLISAWPENTFQLATESRWNCIYRLDKIQRDIPEFQPKVTFADAVAPCVAWMEAHGMVKDSRECDKEDRIIAAVDRLWGSMGLSGLAATLAQT